MAGLSGILHSDASWVSETTDDWGGRMICFAYGVLVLITCVQQEAENEFQYIDKGGGALHFYKETMGSYLTVQQKKKSGGMNRIAEKRTVETSSDA
jgi:hypothetical protein